MQTQSTILRSGAPARAWAAARAAALCVSIVIILAQAAYGARLSLRMAEQLTRTERVPNTDGLARLGLAYEDVRFPARGGDAEIAGSFIPAPGATGAVVLVHGKGHNRTSELAGGFLALAASLHRQGLATLLIDLRGHGDSTPARSSFGTHEARDIAGATDWLRARGFAAGRIGVLGISMGAAAAIIAALDEPAIGAVAADAAYADFTSLLRAHWPGLSPLPEALLVPTLAASRLGLGIDLAAARPIDALRGYRGTRVLLIQGAADELVPAAHAQRLHEAYPASELWIVPGAGHTRTYAADPAEYTRRVGAFFAEALR